MYKKYFGIRKAPFSIAPDPRYLYMSAQHKEALAHLLYGVRLDGGFVLLTGEVGTGKTTICRCLLERLPKSCDVAFVINPKLSSSELLATICDEFRISYPKTKASTKFLVDSINEYLLTEHAGHRKALLLIDEAQNLSDEVLEQIRLLTNLETNERKLLQIILIGQPELRERLARPELRQLAQRIVARYHLKPLSREELAPYVSHRLQVAGLRAEIFTAQSLRSLYAYSGGIPRIINAICDRALLGAFVQDKRRIEKKILVKAAREVLGESRVGSTPNRLTTVLAAAAMLLLLAAAGTGYYYHTRQTVGAESMEAAANKTEQQDVSADPEPAETQVEKPPEPEGQVPEPPAETPPEKPFR
ncbi:MAG: AAA family ATPase [Desulfobacteraceae bacterium]|nr:AAA family ATPase [Desulfobacteraceae bacterium]